MGAPAACGLAAQSWPCMALLCLSARPPGLSSRGWWACRSGAASGPVLQQALRDRLPVLRSANPPDGMPAGVSHVPAADTWRRRCRPAAAHMTLPAGSLMLAKAREETAINPCDGIQLCVLTAALGVAPYNLQGWRGERGGAIQGMHCLGYEGGKGRWRSE